MKRIIQETEDGSKTIYIEDWNESYHSKHGAVQEAMHVFIKNGFSHFITTKKPLKILEIGLGTGLNAFITLLEAEKNQQYVNYVGIEKFPVLEAEFDAIDFFDDVFKFYPELAHRKEELHIIYRYLFLSDWENWQIISPYFRIKKVKDDFFNLKNCNETEFDLVYFDAFGSQVQPEMWEKELFEIIDSTTKPTAIFTTYASKGTVKRGLKELGYVVEKRPGPPGKREMMVGLKNFSL
ncbi:tRNA (5-methylaminomethyl-2-thiouridine)(34)-methyltransferase MnmD [Algoriella sp.]|uniref:tRNA (5-methylaminomethyl-2-thiouridine)(34)-methyltransferase MnmD n=2 Tax=Algoriella sp. TaxID=1872434 RepID=UPI002FC80A14